MGTEKPHHEFGQQRDLFRDDEQDVVEAAVDATTPQPETLPTFAELKSEFFTLTGYRADGYGFTSESENFNELSDFINDLKPLSPEDRRGRLIGRAAKLDSDKKWWE